ncbi:hypothetical protein AURDEDRAFT_110572 [Auricularia subglabra TFB-10046 SS5]|nr:hypothetical protein AURDEDRAFT_110572 [Auricularia subglabra TFB-10046 SS5]
MRMRAGGQPTPLERKFDKDGLPVYALPREKMRALVGLYHEAGDFITPENLDARIDAAFTGGTAHQHERGLHELQKELRRRNEEPDYVRFYRSSLSRSAADVAGTRIERVRAALWGTTDDGRPGLEIVEEERDDHDRTEQTQARLEQARRR